jgi:hypothetical protein
MLKLKDVTSNIEHNSFIYFFHYTNAVNLLDFFLNESHASKAATTHFGREHNSGIILSFLLHLM